jgi:hypothetical protein
MGGNSLFDLLPRPSNYSASHVHSDLRKPNYTDRTLRDVITNRRDPLKGSNTRDRKIRQPTGIFWSVIDRLLLRKPKGQAKSD